jgi:hypothetical protein
MLNATTYAMNAINPYFILFEAVRVCIWISLDQPEIILELESVMRSVYSLDHDL